MLVLIYILLLRKISCVYIITLSAYAKQYNVVVCFLNIQLYMAT